MHIRIVPRSVKIYVGKTTLNLKVLEYSLCRFGSLVFRALEGVGVGKEAKVEGGSFGAVEEG